MQSGADRRGRRLAGAVGAALVVGVLADREGLGVTGAVRRVRVGALLRVTVAEVLRLAVAAGVRLGPALLAAAVLLIAVLLTPVRLLLRGRGRVAVRLLASLWSLLSVRRSVLLRSRLRGPVVPAASDPESSHVIERTWSRTVTCWVWAIRGGLGPSCDIP